MVRYRACAIWFNYFQIKARKIFPCYLVKKVGTSGDIIGRYERYEVKPSIETAFKIAKALEVSLDYLTGLSDLELDRGIVDVVKGLQKLNSGDKEHIFTTINALVCDAKARNTYA